MNKDLSLPVLYSFRRCPYAIRARMALYYAGVRCELREVSLKQKPPEMLALSEKATVPILQLENVVLDESLQIIKWAIGQSNPEGWQEDESSHYLVARNDAFFKPCLDQYKYFERYPKSSRQHSFNQACTFLAELEAALVVDNKSANVYLGTPSVSLIDIAIFPFVRQFAAVDRQRFDTLGLPKLVYWLDDFLASPLFCAVMEKYPRWISQESRPVLFGPL